jgi:hypothetical protein
MVAFGFGSMLGSWLGGKLSDKIGFYKIMVLVYLPADYCSSRFNTYAHFGIVHRNVCHYDYCRYVSSRYVCVSRYVCKARKPYPSLNISALRLI